MFVYLDHVVHFAKLCRDHCENWKHSVLRSFADLDLVASENPERPASIGEPLDEMIEDVRLEQGNADVATSEPQHSLQLREHLADVGHNLGGVVRHHGVQGALVEDDGELVVAKIHLGSVHFQELQVRSLVLVQVCHLPYHRVTQI